MKVGHNGMSRADSQTQMTSVTGECAFFHHSVHLSFCLYHSVTKMRPIFGKLQWNWSFFLVICPDLCHFYRTVFWLRTGQSPVTLHFWLQHLSQYFLYLLTQLVLDWRHHFLTPVASLRCSSTSCFTISRWLAAKISRDPTSTNRQFKLHIQQNTNSRKEHITMS